MKVNLGKSIENLVCVYINISTYIRDFMGINLQRS